METLITLLVFGVIAAIANWFTEQKRKKLDAERQREGSSPNVRPLQRPSESQPPPAPAFDWQEELRRVLQGDEPVPPPRPPPPPVLRPATPPPVPRPQPAQVSKPIIVVRPSPVVETEGTGLPVTLPSLTQSASAYTRAQNLESSVEGHMREAREQVSRHTVRVAPRRTTAEVAGVVKMIRGPQGARTAILASIILGPPKALENS